MTNNQTEDDPLKCSYKLQQQQLLASSSSSPWPVWCSIPCGSGSKNTTSSMTDGPRMRKQKLTRFSQLSKITTRRRGCTDFHPKGHMSEWSSSSEYSKPGRDPHDLPAPGSHLYGVQNKSGLTRPRDAAALTQVIQSNPANPGDPHLM